MGTNKKNNLNLNSGVIFLQENSGEVYLNNFQIVDPQSYVSNWFSVLEGDFTLKNTIFEQGNFTQILSSTAGNISIFDCEFINSIFTDDIFYFSSEYLFVSFKNITFFKNLLTSSFINFYEIDNSTIIIDSLNFSNNNPYDFTSNCGYLYFSSGENNTISFQNYLIFSNSVSSYFFHKKYIIL